MSGCCLDTCQWGKTEEMEGKKMGKFCYEGKFVAFVAYLNDVHLVNIIVGHRPLVLMR